MGKKSKKGMSRAGRKTRPPAGQGRLKAKQAESNGINNGKDEKVSEQNPPERVESPVGLNDTLRSNGKYVLKPDPIVEGKENSSTLSSNDERVLAANKLTNGLVGSGHSSANEQAGEIRNTRTKMSVQVTKEEEEEDRVELEDDSRQESSAGEYLYSESASTDEIGRPQDETEEENESSNFTPAEETGKFPVDTTDATNESSAPANQMEKAPSKDENPKTHESLGKEKTKAAASATSLSEKSAPVPSEQLMTEETNLPVGGTTGTTDCSVVPHLDGTGIQTESGVEETNKSASPDDGTTSEVNNLMQTESTVDTKLSNESALEKKAPPSPVSDDLTADMSESGEDETGKSASERKGDKNMHAIQGSSDEVENCLQNGHPQALQKAVPETTPDLNKTSDFSKLESVSAVSVKGFPSTTNGLDPTEPSSASNETPSYATSLHEPSAQEASMKQKDCSCVIL